MGLIIRHHQFDYSVDDQIRNRAMSKKAQVLRYRQNNREIHHTRDLAQKRRRTLNLEVSKFRKEEKRLKKC